MSTSIEKTTESNLLTEGVQIPLGILTLEDFRQWARSDNFPEHGRIDFLKNCIEVDMSPEDLFCHGSAKMEIGTCLYLLAVSQDLGVVFTDSTRISSPIAELSAEPDVVFLSHETLDADKARLIPKANNAERRFVEIEGAVDLVVEIMSDSSVAKDTRRLPPAYFDAGVREFWLVDARGEALRFQIHHRGESEFLPVTVDEDGFQKSEVFNLRYRLERALSSRDYWKYDLQTAE